MNAPDTPAAQAHTSAGPTELAARRRIAPVAGKLRGRVLFMLAQFGDEGLTATEATTALGYDLDRLYSVAPRLPELVKDGYAAVAGRRGDRQVYVATTAGLAWASEVAA